MFRRSWHGIKYIDPAESGAVLPILHVNGFKISERTIYGCMDNKELSAYFSGCGYHPRIVEDMDNIDADLNGAFEWALSEIRNIQKAARSGKPIMKPRWPMLILRTPKVCLFCVKFVVNTLAYRRTGLDRTEKCSWADHRRVF